MTGTLSRGIFLAIGILFGMTAVQAQAQTMASVVMDARTGKILQATNGTTRVHPASLTKMMTLYIAFDQLQKGQLSLDRKVTVSASAAAEPPSRLGLREGQQIEVRYLIRAAAIKSANDAATALGEAIGGSEANFAKMMNAYARAMGMDNTTFRNANGLTAEGHMSSARDMAMLGRRLVYDFPQYYNIFSRNSTSAGLATVRNTNRRLLDAYPGADGIKTGYTKAAGFNLVSSAKRGDKRVIVALLGGRSSAARNAEVARLMDVGFAKMPARARQVPLVALNVPGVRIARTQVAAATNATLLDAPDAPLTLVRGSTAGVADGPGEDQMDEEDALAAAESPTAAAPVSVVATKGTADGMLPILRPRPRAAAFAGVEVARQRETIAAAISEVNAEIAEAGRATVRPAPRPGGALAAEMSAPSNSASTFAALPAAPRRAAPTSEPTAAPAGVEVASAGAGTTGGNDWGVQLGAYRAKGEAERQLLTTALRDVPELSGGLRRVEAAKVQGVTVFRAQFVGLSQQSALSACAALARQNTECMPLAPGI